MADSVCSYVRLKPGLFYQFVTTSNEVILPAAFFSEFNFSLRYRNCHTANLNGYNYGSDFAEAIGDGIYWKGQVEKAGSLARVEMAIKGKKQFH